MTRGCAQVAGGGSPLHDPWPAADGAAPDLGAPARCRPDPAGEPDEGAPGAPPPIEVLYIEDNQSNQRLVALALARQGLANVQVAPDGLAGLARIDDQAPDLVLLDLHLPDIDGDEVLRRLRSGPGAPGPPVVVLSADATPSRIRSLRAEGAAEYLTKPIDLQQLRDTVARLGRAGPDSGPGPG